MSPSLARPTTASWSFPLRFRMARQACLNRSPYKSRVFAGELHLQPEAGPGHTSALQAASTSLRSNYVWGRADSVLQINYTSTDGSVFVDTQPQVYLRYSGGMNDVSAMFQYSPSLNQLSLNSASVADFRTMLMPMAGPLELSVTSTDSAGNNVELYVPVVNGGFQINGTSTFAQGETSESLAGTPVTLQGVGLGYNATTTLDSSGAFTLDNLPLDTYAVDIVTAGGLLGMDFTAFDGSASAASSAVVLFGSDVTAMGVGKNGPVAQVKRGKPGRSLPGGTAPRAQDDSLGYRDLGDQSEAAVRALAIALDPDSLPNGLNVRQYSTLGAGLFPVSFQVQSRLTTDAEYFSGEHPCIVSPGVPDTAWRFTVYGNGQILLSKQGAYCSTSLSFDADHFTPWALTNLAVYDPAVMYGVSDLRILIATKGNAEGTTAPWIIAGVADSPFTVTSLIPTHADGTLPLADGKLPRSISDAFYETLFSDHPKDPGKHSFVGIPAAGKSSFTKWVCA